MQHFFVTPDQVGDKEIWITGEDGALAGSL